MTSIDEQRVKDSNGDQIDYRQNSHTQKSLREENSQGKKDRTKLFTLSFAELLVLFSFSLFSQSLVCSSLSSSLCSYSSNCRHCSLFLTHKLISLLYLLSIEPIILLSSPSSLLLMTLYHLPSRYLFGYQSLTSMHSNDY